MPYRCSTCKLEFSDEVAQANDYLCGVRSCHGRLERPVAAAYELPPGKLPLSKIAELGADLERHERAALRLKEIHSLLEQVMYLVDPAFVGRDGKTQAIDRIQHLAPRFGNVASVRWANRIRNGLTHILEKWPSLDPAEQRQEVENFERAGEQLQTAVTDLLPQLPTAVRSAVEGGVRSGGAARRDAHFRNVRADSTTRDGRSGFLVVVSFVVGGWESGDGYLDVQFWLDGKPLASSEPAAPGHLFRPTRDKVAWDGLEFFLPYEGLPGGAHRLEYQVRIREKEASGRRGDSSWRTVKLGERTAKTITVEVPVDVRITDVKDVHDVEREGRPGILVHVAFEVAGLAGVPLHVTASFVRDDGAPLTRPRSAAEPRGGAEEPVRRPAPFRTAEHRDRRLDFELFVAYDELALSHGRHRLTTRVEIARVDAAGTETVLATRDAAPPFERHSPPTRAFATTRSELREELNHEQGGELGMAIVASFGVQNMGRWDGRLVAFFRDDEGVDLADQDGKYKTTDGKVAASASFATKTDDDRLDDQRVFIPYSQLHLPPGRHAVRYLLFVRQMNPVKDLVRWDERRVEVVVPPVDVAATVTSTERAGVVAAGTGDIGMAIVASPTFRGLTGWPVRVVALLCDAVGAPLKDPAGAPVTVEGVIETPTDGSLPAPWQLFVPYARLPLGAGPQTVSYVLEIWLRDAPKLLVRGTRRTVAIVMPPTEAAATAPTVEVSHPTVKGQAGVRMRTSFRVTGMAKWPGQVVARFWRGDGAEVTVPEGAGYRLTTGQAAAWTKFQPASNDEQMNLELFIPHAVLGIASGTHALAYEIRVRQLRVAESTDVAKELHVSNRIPLSVTIAPPAPPPSKPILPPAPPVIRPSVTVGERMDMTVAGHLGMLIDIVFTVPAGVATTIECGAFFYAPDNTPLKDFDKNYYSHDGNVWTGELIDLAATPNVRASTLFIPYAQLHLIPGRRHALKYFVVIAEKTPWRELARTGWREFSVQV